ncbi:aldehyde dehydrogenase (NADP(+)), partial [Rhodobacter sp. 24-YEA-8]|uniref:aldehyde dehydrogenase (NADP(+)) n=1 Tax=Rhodobacter sp. 24-YEA-8 TaxID=1884310 RepID=UPI00089BD63C
EAKFSNEPVSGPAQSFSVGTVALVDQAAKAAGAAFQAYAGTSRETRAAFLEKIAEEIESRAEAITEIGSRETGLPAARLEGERGRTVGQLLLFAAHIRSGEHLDLRYDAAQPDRKPAPRPEIRLVQRPVGPVAVFGASNFPLAFSTAGGDTAAALAAGCPVVVKGHSAHPGTAEIIAEAILSAITACGLNPGIFNLIQGGRRDVGSTLVQHPQIKAVGFTGSLAGGRALFDLCAQRPDPIPFFGELGSVNPMFILPAAASTRAAEIGTGWAGSLTMGAGQFCTNPGIAIVIDGAAADVLTAAAVAALAKAEPQAMLTTGIADACRSGIRHFHDHPSVRILHEDIREGREAGACLYEVSGADFLADHSLSEEVFGPVGLVVRVGSTEEMLQLAECFEGQLTATLHMDVPDGETVRALLPVLERKAGRILANGFPTGVEVVGAMVHGGPWPASTNFGATSVGTMAIRRFLRPLSLQNIPEALTAYMA